MDNDNKLCDKCGLRPQQKAQPKPCACKPKKCCKKKDCCNDNEFAFRKVVIPASLGDDVTGQDKPANGAYTNSYVEYEANGTQYMYDSYGVYTKIEGGGGGGTSDFNELINRPKYAGSEMTSNTDIPDVNAAVAAEAELRAQADNGLQSQIDAITVSSDVKDVVGTKADLNNYDTSTLGNNDIIKVLQDESENDATTYYRWNSTTQQFTLIGEEGPYYTKSAADLKFQDKLVAGTNISIDPQTNTISATGSVQTVFYANSTESGQYRHIYEDDSMTTAVSAQDVLDANEAGQVVLRITTSADPTLYSDAYLQNTYVGTNDYQFLFLDDRAYREYDATATADTSFYYTYSEIQPKLTAGANITITGNTISAADNDTQSDYTENDSADPSYIQNRPFYEESVTSTFEQGTSTSSGSTPDTDYVWFIEQMLDYSLYSELSNFSDGDTVYANITYSVNGTEKSDEGKFTLSITGNTASLDYDAPAGSRWYGAYISEINQGDTTIRWPVASTDSSATIYITSIEYTRVSQLDSKFVKVDGNTVKINANGELEADVQGGPTVVQTTGTSQTDVMSQDASTKLVYANADGNGNRGICVPIIDGYSNRKTVGAHSIMMGTRANGANLGNNNISIGYNAGPINDTIGSAVCIGNSAKTAGANAVVIGDGADSSTSSVNTVAIGSSAKVKGNSSFGTAIGPAASVSSSAPYAVAIGYNAKGSYNSSVAIGYSSMATAANRVSVGNPNLTRAIEYVTDPTNAQDAATKNYVDTKLTYTTTEQVVGTWIDGKPIYRRVVQFGSNELPSNSTVDIADVSSWDIDMTVDIRGMVGFQTGHGSLSTSFRPLTLAGGGADDIRIDIDSEKLRIRTYSTWSGFDRNFIIVEYTKTTD